MTFYASKSPSTQIFQLKKTATTFPWTNPLDFLQLFSSSKKNHISATNKWEKTILCDWINPAHDLEKSAIAKECQLHFIPTLLPFSNKKAVFFCLTLNETIRVASKGHISWAANSIYLHRYHRMVNAIDSNFSQFRGWISIKGLLFYFWTVETFKSIANQVGPVIEIDEHALNHRNLFEAKIRVEYEGASSIP